MFCILMSYWSIHLLIFLIQKRKSKRDHVSLFARGKSTRTFLVLLLLLLMYTWHSTTNNNRSVGNQFDAFDGTKARVEMEKQKETIHCNFPQNILVEKSINLALKVQTGSRTVKSNFFWYSTLKTIYQKVNTWTNFPRLFETWELILRSNNFVFWRIEDWRERCSPFYPPS